MLVRFAGFNTYLLLAMLLIFPGCKSAEQRKRDKTLSALRLHVTASPDPSGHTETVLFAGLPLNVNKSSFLDESSILEARVVDTQDGGFALRLQADDRGTFALANATTSNKGRNMVVFAQFGYKQLTSAGWIAAPLINAPVTNGILMFTVALTREQADELALGLNNVSKQIEKQSWFGR